MLSFDSSHPFFQDLGFYGKEVHTLIHAGYNSNPLTSTFNL